MFRTQTRGFALARPTARRFRTSSFSFDPDPGVARNTRAWVQDPAATPQPEACLEVLLSQIDDGDHPLLTPVPAS